MPWGGSDKCSAMLAVLDIVYPTRGTKTLSKIAKRHPLEPVCIDRQLLAFVTTSTGAVLCIGDDPRLRDYLANTN